MNCLVITLGDVLRIQCFESCPDQFKNTNFLSYKRKSSDSDNGFYDWLRGKSGKLIGVRWFPYDGAMLRELSSTNKCESVEVSADCLEMKIFFSSDRVIDESKSCDQDFLENNIYYLVDGGWAISFSMTGLSPREQLELCSGLK